MGKVLEGSYLAIPPLPRAVQISLTCAVIYSSFQSWKWITARGDLPQSNPVFQLLALLVFLTQVLPVEFSVLSWTAIASFLKQLIKLSFYLFIYFLRYEHPSGLPLKSMISLPEKVPY